MTIFSIPQELLIPIDSLSHNVHYYDLFRGTERAKFVNVALFCWFAYEHCITFNEELKYYWRNPPWTRAKVLFLVNRYMTWCTMIVTLYAAVVSNPTVQATFILNSFVFTIGQAHISIFWWNIWESSRLMRTTIATMLILTFVTPYIIMSSMTGRLTVLNIVDIPEALKYSGSLFTTGCKITFNEEGKRRMWFSQWFPPLIYHAYIWLCGASKKMVPYMADKEIISPTEERIYRDTHIVFFVASGTLCYTIITSALYKTPLVSIPGSFCPIALTTISITISRKGLSTWRMLRREENGTQYDSEDQQNDNFIELMRYDVTT